MNYRYEIIIHWSDEDNIFAGLCISTSQQQRFNRAIQIMDQCAGTLRFQNCIKITYESRFVDNRTYLIVKYTHKVRILFSGYLRQED